MIVQVSTAPDACFCTTWGNKTNEILHFILAYFVCLGFSQVVQKQAFSKVETKTVI